MAEGFSQCMAGVVPLVEGGQLLKIAKDLRVISGDDLGIVVPSWGLAAAQGPRRQQLRTLALALSASAGPCW